MKVSLIITTYNWPEALEVVLRSALSQSWTDFEILVADDGSATETADTVNRVLSPSSLAWKHIRQEDSSIRQARVKNMAVRHARGDYFIFIDHDVALHPDFIADHIENGSKGVFLQGKRVFLSEQLTRTFIDSRDFFPPSPWAPGLENRKNGFRSPGLAKRINLLKNFQVTLRGCNLSMHRDTFMNVDGYDEVFDGIWGREDSDICYRMFNQGIKIKNLWLAGLQYHLHHPSIKRKGRDRLDEELDLCLKEKRIAALEGYSKMSPEGEIVAQGGPDRKD